jgi:hypothetical protein
MNEREEPMGSTDDPSVLARQSTPAPGHASAAEMDIRALVRRRGWGVVVAWPHGAGCTVTMNVAGAALEVSRRDRHVAFGAMHDALIELGTLEP